MPIRYLELAWISNVMCLWNDNKTWVKSRQFYSGKFVFNSSITSSIFTSLGVWFSSLVVNFLPVYFANPFCLLFVKENFFWSLFEFCASNLTLCPSNSIATMSFVFFCLVFLAFLCFCSNLKSLGSLWILTQWSNRSSVVLNFSLHSSM